MDIRSILSGGSDQKAIPATPMLMDQSTPLTFKPQGAKDRRTRLTQLSANRHLQAYGGTDAIDWVMDCVRLISETAATASYHFEKEGKRLEPFKKPNQLPGTEFAPEILVDLIKEPNPFMDYEELIELLVIDLLLVGNAYWYKYKVNEKGQPLSLFRLAPPFIRVVPGAFGVEQYEYKVAGQDKPLKLDPSDIVHFKLPNPHSPYLGLGVIQGGARPLDLELAITETQASYYENHGQPSMVVQSERRVPRDVFTKLQRQLRGRIQGPRKAGELLLLEAGLKYESIAPNAAEAEFATISRLSRDRIAAMFRVPLALIFSEGDNASSGEINNAQRLFDTKTMKPLLRKIEKVVSRGLTKAWGVEFKIDYDYIMPIEDRIKLTTAFAAIPGVRVREVREYAGLDPIGDPEIDDLILNVPGEEGTEEDPRNGFPDKNAAGEAGRPPRPENTKLFPGPGDPLPDGSRVRRPRDVRRPSERGKALTIDEIIFEMEAKEAELGWAEGKAASAPEDSVAQFREADIDAIVADLKEELADATQPLERKLLDHAEGKAVGSGLIKRIKESPIWKQFQTTIAESLQRAAARAMSTAVIHEGTRGNVAEEEIDYEELAKTLVHRRDGVKAITDNLRDDIVKIVGEALEKEQVTRDDIERAIREQIATWADSKAETIALTEATRAYNLGTLEVAREVGTESVYVTDGHDHDEPCIEADGQTWTIEFAIDNLIEHPRCRRAFIPVTE